MKRLLNLIVVLLLTVASVSGQQGPPMKRIHAAKIAYITDRMELSQEQSGSFIPLYNEYEKDLRAIRQSFFKKYKGANDEGHDEMGSRQFLEDDLDYQQKVVDLKRKYHDDFLKVISAKQLTELYKAEREFRQMLMQKLKQRRGGDRWR